MSTVRMKVVPPPNDADGLIVLPFLEEASRQGGKGDVDFVCGACEKVLLHNLLRGTTFKQYRGNPLLKDEVGQLFQCPCGAINEFPVAYNAS